MSRHAAPARRGRPTDSITVGDIVARYGVARYGVGGARRAHHARRRSGPALPSLSLTARPMLAATVVLSTATALEVPHLVTDAGRASQPRGVSSPAATAPATPTSTPQPRAPARTARVSRGTKRTVLRAVRKPGHSVPGVWVRPNAGPESSCFCRRWGTMHWGVDLAGPLGSPILAAGDGTVLRAGPAEGFGNWVVIQHANGDVSIYGHMRYYFVHAGEAVRAGQRIALVGSEGHSTGPHLHFEIHRGGLDGAKIDPVPWLAARGIRVGAYEPNG